MKPLVPADDSPSACLLHINTSEAEGLSLLAFVIRGTLHLDLVTHEGAFAPLVRTGLTHAGLGDAGVPVPWLGTRITTDEHAREVFGEGSAPDHQVVA